MPFFDETKYAVMFAEKATEMIAGMSKKRRLTEEQKSVLRRKAAIEVLEELISQRGGLVGALPDKRRNSLKVSTPKSNALLWALRNALIREQDEMLGEHIGVAVEMMPKIGESCEEHIALVKSIGSQLDAMPTPLFEKVNYAEAFTKNTKQRLADHSKKGPLSKAQISILTRLSAIKVIDELIAQRGGIEGVRDDERHDLQGRTTPRSNLALWELRQALVLGSDKKLKEVIARTSDNLSTNEEKSEAHIGLLASIGSQLENMQIPIVKKDVMGYLNHGINHHMISYPKKKSEWDKVPSRVQDRRIVTSAIGPFYASTGSSKTKGSAAKQGWRGGIYMPMAGIRADKEGVSRFEKPYTAEFGDFLQKCLSSLPPPEYESLKTCMLGGESPFDYKVEEITAIAGEFMRFGTIQDMYVALKLSEMTTPDNPLIQNKGVLDHFYRAAEAHLPNKAALDQVIIDLKGKLKDPEKIRQCELVTDHEDHETQAAQETCATLNMSFIADMLLTPSQVLPLREESEKFDKIAETCLSEDSVNLYHHKETKAVEKFHKMKEDLAEAREDASAEAAPTEEASEETADAVTMRASSGP